MPNKQVRTSLGVKGVFDKIEVDSISGIRVFYVGQGDAIGLLNEIDEVVLYIDYGGLIDHPDKINNYSKVSDRLKPYYGNEHVPVLLTHWDKDHYYSAKHVKDMLDSQWVFPDQRMGIQATQFSAQLNNAFTWPENDPPIVMSFFTLNGDEVRIEKIKPLPNKSKTEDRNLTGLSITVIKNGDSPPFNFIQLPGDAPYHKIPELCSLRKDVDYVFIGGTAYHHGSDRHWIRATSDVLGVPNPKARLVYSYGPSNTYHHPRTCEYDVLKWKGKTKRTPDYKSKGYIDIKF